MKTKTNIHTGAKVVGFKINSCTNGCLKGCQWNNGYYLDWLAMYDNLRDQPDTWPGEVVKCYNTCTDNYCGGRLNS